MPVVEIISVEKSPLDYGSLYGAILDSPKPGSASDVYQIDVSGWALGRGSRAESVEAYAGEEVLARAAVDRKRPDIAAVFPNAENGDLSGFRLTVDAMRLNTDLEFGVRLILADQRKVQLASVRGRRTQPRPGAEPAVAPAGTKRFEALLAYADPYVKSTMEPPVGIPSDFISAARLSEHSATVRDFGSIELGEEILRFAQKDTSPIPATGNRAGYFGEFHGKYWLCGVADYVKTVEVAARHGVTGGRMLDFGGSTGRVARHFLHQSDNWEVWSCDFDMTSVEWALTHLPPKGKFFLNSYYPTLPLEDNSFDLITAFSVFTHLDETELGWLLELRRILKPGGCAYLTVHDEHTWNKKPQKLFEAVGKTRPDLLDTAEIPAGKTVVNWREDSPYRCNVFHAGSYIESVWGRFVHVVERIPLGHNIQSVCVIKK